MVFTVFVISGVSLRDLCLPSTSHSSSPPDILVYLPFPKPAMFPGWFPMSRKTFLCVTLLPLHCSPVDPSLACTHLADPHSDSLRCNSRTTCSWKLAKTHALVQGPCCHDPVPPRALCVVTVAFLSVFSVRQAAARRNLLSCFPGETTHVTNM